jgi:hypothetical protein
MIENGRVTGVYNNTALSHGLQAGVQTFAEAMFLTTDAALNYLHSSDGWSIGMGPGVVVVDAGAARSLTTTTLQSDVYAFIFEQQGLMGGVVVQGRRSHGSGASGRVANALAPGAVRSRLAAAKTKTLHAIAAKARNRPAAHLVEPARSLLHRVAMLRG